MIFYLFSFGCIQSICSLATTRFPSPRCIFFLLLVEQFLRHSFFSFITYRKIGCVPSDVSRKLLLNVTNAHKTHRLHKKFVRLSSSCTLSLFSNRQFLLSRHHKIDSNRKNTRTEVSTNFYYWFFLVHSECIW